MQVGPGSQLQASITSAGLGNPNNMQNSNFGPGEDSVSFSSPLISPVVPESRWKRFTHWLSGKNSSGQSSSLPPWLVGLGGLMVAGLGAVLLKKFKVPVRKTLEPSAASSWKRSPEDIRTLDAEKKSLSASNVSEIRQSGSVDSAGRVKDPVGPHDISVENGYAPEWVTIINSPEGMTTLKKSILKSLRTESHMGSGSFAQAFAIPLRARDAEKKLVFDQPVLRVDKLGKEGKKLDPSTVKNKLLTVTGKTQVQSEYRVIPIRYKANERSMLEDKNLGLPFAVIVPKGHPAFAEKTQSVGLEDLENLRGSVLRRVGGQPLHERKGVNKFADVLSRSTYLKTKMDDYSSRLSRAESEIKKRRISESKKEELQKEINELRIKNRDVTAEYNRTKKYAIVQDLHGHIMSKPSQPNLECKSWESQYSRYSSDERAAYEGFVTDYLADIKQLGDMPQKTFNDIIKSLKNIDAAGAKVDYSHGANMFYDAEKKQWTFIDLALSKAERGEISTQNEKGEWVRTVHTSKALSLNQFVDVALGKSSWGIDFLPSKYVQGTQRAEMHASMKSFLAKLESAAKTHHINNWDANEIRRREGLI